MNTMLVFYIYLQNVSHKYYSSLFRTQCNTYLEVFSGQSRTSWFMLDIKTNMITYFLVFHLPGAQLFLGVKSSHIQLLVMSGSVYPASVPENVIITYLYQVLLISGIFAYIRFLCLGLLDILNYNASMHMM